MEIIPEDRKEEETILPPVVSYASDVDATWIKRGKKSYYGYKAHISVDGKDGYVLGGYVTPANVADTTELEKIVDELDLPEGSVIFADKEYAGENNRGILAQKKLNNGIMDKASRNKPLRSIQLIINKLIPSCLHRLNFVVSSSRSSTYLLYACVGFSSPPQCAFECDLV